ncbi:MAG: flippase-like domain-containing protein [Gammaproteobacteria bacterium]|nr:flippase-like domain-containing protein [Gammaproteobacteria bacterium]MDH5730680.1 flippase-like domain-containing protein [Gammaproteobacteria bacterium]
MQTSFNSKSLLIRILFGAMFLGALLWIASQNINLQQLLQPWQALPYQTLLLMIAIMALSYTIRSIRLYDYFNMQRNDFLLCLKITLQHNMYNNLLPMRSGELSFPVLLKHFFKLDIRQSASALLWFRLLDLYCLFIFSIYLLQWWLGASSVITLLILILPLPWLLFHYQTSFFSRLQNLLPTRFGNTVEKLHQGLPQHQKAFWRSLFWSFFNWLLKLGLLAWFLTLFSPMPLSAAWFGAIGGDLSSVLPIHGIAGFGTYEAGVAAGLALFKLAPQAILQAAINLHLFILGMSIISGLLSFLIRRKSHG